MGIMDMVTFVNNLIDAFENIYNLNFSIDGYQEDSNLLYNGYCLYFSCLLKELITEGNVVSIPGHYIFEYKGYYFDGTGLLCFHDGILIFPNGRCVKQEDLNIVDAKQEFMWRDILGMSDLTKDTVWEQLKPELLKIGKQLLIEIETKKHRGER